MGFELISDPVPHQGLPEALYSSIFQLTDTLSSKVIKTRTTSRSHSCTDSQLWLNTRLLYKHPKK